MRRFKRIKSMDERNALVTDAALRDRQWQAYVDSKIRQQVLEFTVAYDKWYEAVFEDPNWMDRRAGVFFRIDTNTELSAAKFTIIERYRLWVQEEPGADIVPLESVFQWGPESRIYGFRSGYEPDIPESEDIFVRKRTRDM